MIKELTLIFARVSPGRQGVNRAVAVLVSFLFFLAVKWYSAVIHRGWCAAPTASIVSEPHSEDQ